MTGMTREQRLSEIRKADTEVRDAEEILQSMNLNARNVPGPQGVKLQSKIKEYESDTSKMKKEIRRLEASFTEMADRDSLMNGAILKDDLAISMDQRERLLAGTDRLNKGTTQLQQARRTAEDTVAVGQGIITNLAEQRETMTRGLNRLDTINDRLTRSSRILSSMARRVATNKLIMAVIVLVLLGAIGLIIWLKWFYKSK